MAGSTKLLTAGGGGVILTPASSIASDVTVNIPSQNGTLVVPNSSGSFTTSNFNSDSTFGFKNRIINGAMVIDQRYAGAATANSINGYVVDRWVVNQSTTGKLIAQQNAGSVTPPSGFSNYLGITSQSAYTLAAGDYYVISQYIEGFNFADMAWGTANAATVTLSFWVRSSLTGTFGGSLRNGASNRSYPFTYSIPVANTWTSISITISGDTTGTWVGATNGIGTGVNFGLGVGSTYSGTASSWSGSNYVSATGAQSVVGTNGATFYITGVQLEKGSVATTFDFRSYGTELALCQRYYQQSYDIGYAPGTTYATYSGSFVEGSIGAPNSTSLKSLTVKYTVPLRALPTFTPYDTAGTAGKVSTDNVGTYTAGQAYGIATNGVQSITIFMNNSVNCGTLAFAYTASAEL